MQPSDEIKSKLDIVDIIRDYIQLKPAGVNFRANCPFHREKTPSFMVSPEKQIWHCFGCGKGGDVISFVKEIEGLSFVEALRILAPKAGVTLRRENPALTSQRNRLLDILEVSVSYYRKILLESPLAAEARAYLEKRGLSEKTIEDWQIGFSPDSWDDLVSLLKNKNFKDSEIFAAGMSIKKEGMNRFYNRFRGRLMFPINDVNGDAVAFTARVMPSKEATEKMGKYVNSPQTQIYDKSRILFGLDKAKMAIKAADAAIVVEGQMDVITAHQHNFKNVIASSGTALTPEQLILLKRYTNNVFLAFDMDSAGQLAADRGIREAMAKEMNIKIVEVPEGKDPDECIKQNSENWTKAVEAAKPMMQYQFDKALTGLDLKNVEHKRLAAKKLLPVVSRLENEIEKDHWLKILAGKLNIADAYLREALAKEKIVSRTRFRSNEAEKAAPVAIRLSREELLSEMLVAILLKFPELIEYSLNHLEDKQLSGEAVRLIYNNLLIYYNNIIEEGSDGANVFIYEDFKNWLRENYPAASSDEIPDNILSLDKLALLADRDYYSFETDQAKNEIIKIIMALRHAYLKKRMKEVEQEIAAAERAGNADATNALLEELSVLNEEYKTLI